MKYCLSSRQHREYLLQADQIRVEFRDRKIIPDLLEEYPKAQIVLVFPAIKDDTFNWKEIEEYNILSKDSLICCVREGADLKECRKHNISNFYYGYPLGSLYDLNALVQLGVRYLVVDIPAFFRMDLVKKLGVPVRAVPNVTQYEYIPHKDGVCGRWIRPEDVALYEDYIEVLEFEDANIDKEQALFRIYAKDKNWPGDLNMLFSNLNYAPATNRLLPNIAEFRLTCGHKCQEGRCHVCYRAFDLTDEEKLRQYKNQP